MILLQESGSIELSWVLWPVAALAAGWLGYFLGRRKADPSWTSAPENPGSRLLPEPGIRWLGQAHDALAIWAIEGAAIESASTTRQVNTAVITPADLEMLERRLIKNLGSEDEGVERMEKGTLLYVSRPAAVAGMLIRPGPSVATDLALDDLRDLANALVFHHALLPTRELVSPVQTLAAVGLGLALQLERLAGGAVAVVVNVHGGPQVIAVSPSGDHRLLLKPADVDSPAGRVSRAEEGMLLTPFDPIGTSITDRRRSNASQVVPIGEEGRRLGAVIIWPPHGRELAAQALADVSSAIRSIETAIATAVTVHELEKTTRTDPLTGLKNRRGLEEEMHKVGTEHGALIYADLDKFKNLNDALGHPAGDAALVHFAAILRDHVRSTDTAARTGGEEFAVWLPGADVARGVEIAERIRNSLSGHRLWIWQQHQWPLTASFGVAGCPETSRSRQNLPAQADAALYQAKHGGRNKVAVAGRSGDWNL
ncbi:MAG: GGDEF domain-containing protein [Gemmatimonadota bacterium]